MHIHTHDEFKPQFYPKHERFSKLCYFLQELLHLVNRNLTATAKTPVFWCFPFVNALRK